jgi:hypothetical protein
MRADFHPFPPNMVYDWLHQKNCSTFSLWADFQSVRKSSEMDCTSTCIGVFAYELTKGPCHLARLWTKLNLTTTSEAHVKRPWAHAGEFDISLVSFDQDDNFQCLSFK